MVDVDIEERVKVVEVVGKEKRVGGSSGGGGGIFKGKQGNGEGEEIMEKRSILKNFNQTQLNSTLTDPVTMELRLQQM